MRVGRLDRRSRRRNPQHVRLTVRRDPDRATRHDDVAAIATGIEVPDDPSRRGVDPRQPAVGDPDGSEADGQAADALGIEVDRGDDLARDRIDAHDLRQPVRPSTPIQTSLPSLATGPSSGTRRPTLLVAASTRTISPMWWTPTQTPPGPAVMICGPFGPGWTDRDRRDDTVGRGIDARDRFTVLVGHPHRARGHDDAERLQSDRDRREPPCR